MADKKNSFGNLTTRDTEMAILAWRALKSTDVDWDTMVEIGGFKNAASARACFGPVKKKLLEGSATAGTPTKSATKRQAPQGDEDGDATPTKKPRGGRAKKTAAPATEPEAATAVDDESDSGI